MEDSSTAGGAQAQLKESLALVAASESVLVTRVFREMFQRHPEVEPLFAVHSQANRRQMIREILEMVRADEQQSPWLETHLLELGQRHEGYEVNAEMYGWFQECLVHTLAKIAGDAWKPAYEQAWKEALERLSGSMLESSST